MQPIPFFSGAKSFLQYWPEIKDQLNQVFEKCVFTSDAMVNIFEEEIKNFTGSKYAFGTGNCTDALMLSLKALGVGPGDEVILPCFTFVASASSIAHIGAKPVFVDINSQTYNIDVTKIEERITKNTRAIMPVNLFSQMAEMPKIVNIATRYSLKIIEDSAESIGMWLDGTHSGLIGDVGVLSFFPTKTLAAIGDAGMIITNNPDIAEKCNLLRNNGRRKDSPDISYLIGTNSRMDEIQAAILSVRLRHLSDDISKRKKIAEYYIERLSGLSPDVITPVFHPKDYSTNQVFYVFVLQVKNRDALVSYLEQHGIGTEVYYPRPLHLQPCFSYLDYKIGDFPVAETICNSTVAIPMYPDLSIEQMDRVCTVIEEFYK